MMCRACKLLNIQSVIFINIQILGAFNFGRLRSHRTERRTREAQVFVGSLRERHATSVSVSELFTHLLCCQNLYEPRAACGKAARRAFVFMRYTGAPLRARWKRKRFLCPGARSRPLRLFSIREPMWV